MQLTRKYIHEQIYYYGLILIAITLPISIFVVSLVQIILVVNCLTENQFREKWKRIAQNRALHVFLLFFVLHLVGLIWTEELGFGLNIIKIKLPIIILPLIIAVSPQVKMGHVHRIIHLFTMSVLVTSFISVLKLAGWLHGGILGYRDLSPFVHHIRFALMVVTALFFAIYFLFFNRSSVSLIPRILYVIVLIWFPIFLLALKSLTGVMVISVLVFLVLLRAVFSIKDQVVRYMVVVALIMIPLGSLLYVNHAIEKFYSFDQLDEADLDAYTVERNPYSHQTDLKDVENGHYVWIYVCEEELEREWNKLSQIDYHDHNQNGEPVKYTLIRFLSSRGLRKDAVGVQQLSESDIRAIEKGIANYIFKKNFSLYPRLYEVIWEFYSYKIGNAPNGKSILQRYLYLKAGWAVAKENLLFGVGTGDEIKELKRYYDLIDSPLSMEERRGPHNEYLSALTTFGIAGSVIFVGSLVLPLFLTARKKSYMASGFLVLILISMLSSGTLGSTTGSALMGLFYSLFLFGPSFPWLHKSPQLTYDV